MLVNINPLVLAQDVDLKTKDLNISFYSHLFQEDRVLKTQFIYQSKDSLCKRVPVLMVLDADYLFELTSGIVQFLEMSNSYPPILLIGLSNKDRSNELNGNNSKKFCKFINIEVDSVLKANFPNNSSLSIIGHSFSADFILNNEINGLASACILSGVTKNFSFLDRKSTSFYFYSGENDYENRLNFIQKIDSLKSRSPDFKNIISSVIFKKRDHSDIPMSGIPSFIKSYFKQYKSFTESEKTEISQARDKLKALKLTIFEKEEKLKFNYKPSVEDVATLSEIVDSSQFENVFQYLLSLDLDNIASLFVHYYLGSFYEKNKNYKKALKLYQIMYDSLPDWVSNKEQLYENISRVKKKMKK